MARTVKRTTANATATAGTHGKHYPKSITAERTLSIGSIGVEVGPDSGMPQGGMGPGFEYGSVNQPPHLDGNKAADVHEPQFADLALGVQEIFVFYARGIVGHYLGHDDVRLEWAARTASAHLVEALCTWLDLGDPGRDDEAAELMVAGLRALTTAWASVPPPFSA